MKHYRLNLTGNKQNQLTSLWFSPMQREIIEIDIQKIQASKIQHTQKQILDKQHTLQANGPKEQNY